MTERIPPKGYVYITGEIHGQTEKAIRLWDGAKSEWLPRSQIEDIEAISAKTVEVLMPEWLATEKGFI